MAKTATFAVRLDEELKNEAQKVFESMGLPMSLAVELYLRQVVSRGKLPFALGEDEENAQATREREARERAFWKSFILWYFKVWPHFQSEEWRKKAEEDFGFDEFSEGAGSTALAHLAQAGDGDPSTMTSEQRAAASDIYRLQMLLSEAKELIYWALDMDRVFVPSLSSEFSGATDSWQYQYLKEQRRREESDDIPVADGVIGARYFGVDECGDQA